MRDDLLLVDDLMLLLLDDDGASIAGAGTLHYTLGGALLVELAMRGLVETDPDSGGVLNGPIVRTSGTEGLDDPLLRSAYDTVQAKPRRVQPLLLALGADLYQVVADRLIERGLIERRDGRFLGLFKTTSWPTLDARHEAALRERVAGALQHGVQPEPRIAALIGLVYASGAMPHVRPALPWNNTSVRRAQAYAEGDWGAAAVSTAVERTTLAIAVGAAAAAAAAAAAVSR